MNGMRPFASVSRGMPMSGSSAKTIVSNESRSIARYLVASSLAVRDALRAGFGLSLMPYPYVENDLREGRLHAALEDWRTVETTLYAVYPSRQHVAPKIRAFLGFLMEEFGREGEGSDGRHGDS